MVKTKKRAGIKLGIHKATRTYTKCIGLALGKNGQPVKKRWYWPTDDAEAAVTNALKLKARWRKLLAEGKSLWDEEAEYISTSALKHTEEKDAATVIDSSKLITVADFVKLYVDHLKLQFEHGQASDTHHKTQAFRLAKATASPTSKKWCGLTPS